MDCKIEDCFYFEDACVDCCVLAIEEDFVENCTRREE